MIRKGLKKSDALASLTTNPAKIINLDNEIGALEVGKIANFFISSNDIFENGGFFHPIKRVRGAVWNTARVRWLYDLNGTLPWRKKNGNPVTP